MAETIKQKEASSLPSLGVILERQLIHEMSLAPLRNLKGTAIKLCCIHFLVVAVPALLLFFDAPPWWTLGIGGTLVTLAYSYIGYSESQRQDFWLSPISFFFWWYSIGYGFSAIYAATQAYDPGFLPLVTQIVAGEDLAYGYVVTLIGALSLHLGYSLVRSIRSKEHFAKQTSKSKSDFRLWIAIFVVGSIALIRPQYFSGIGAARTILQFAPFGILLVFCSLPNEFFGLSSVLYRMFFTMASVTLIVAALAGSSKFMVMMSLLPIFSAIFVRPKLKKLLPALTLAGIILYLVVVAPILMTARTGNSDETQIQKLRSAAGETVLSFSEDLKFAVSEQLERLLYRQFESTSAGFIVGDVRDRGLKHGETMTNLGYAFIPRIFWPEKPAVTRGNWFTTYLGGAASEEESKTSTGIYSAAELYWNFGFPGIIIGMSIMGGVFAWLLSKIGDGPHHEVVPIVVFMNLIMRIVEQASATEVFVILIYILLITSVHGFLHLPSDDLQASTFSIYFKRV